MSLDFFSGLTERRQAPRFILLTIILMTLPCYCLGAILLATAPDNNESKAEIENTISTLSFSTSSPAASQSSTAPFRTFTPIGQPLRPTSTQLFLRTAIPVYPTWTPIPTIFVTAAPLPTSTPAPTLTPLPTNTTPPTNTLPPSETPTETPTNTDVPVNTEIPAPVITEEVVAVQEQPSPTQETIGS